MRSDSRLAHYPLSAYLLLHRRVKLRDSCYTGSAIMNSSLLPAGATTAESQATFPGNAQGVIASSQCFFRPSCLRRGYCK